MTANDVVDRKVLLGISLLLTFSFVLVFLLENTNITHKKLCRNCNLVIIDIDVLRFDAIDCLNAYERTPNMCKFIKNSVYFKNHSSASVLTITSFVTAMTSLYPISHGVWDDINSTEIQGVKYFAEILDEEGYQSVLMGHVLNYWQVVPKGFDQVEEARHIYAPEFKPVQMIKNLETNNKPFFLYLYLDDLHFPYLLLNDQVLPNDQYGLQGIPKTQSEFSKMQAEYVTENYKQIFTEEAIKNNKELFSGDLRNKKDEILELFFKYSSKRGTMRYIKDAWGPTRDTFFKNFDFDNPDSYKYLKENYLQVLHLIDEQLAGTFEYIENSDLRKNTIVIFRSDHGEEFNEHGFLQHLNNPYQEIIHTPLAIKVPGLKPGEVESLTHDVDIMPTILNLFEINIPPWTQGKSMLPTMKNPEVSARNYQIAQKGGDNYVASFRKDNLKIIIKEGKVIELYELLNDPFEKQNIVSLDRSITNSLFEEYKQIIDKLPRYNEGVSPYPTWIDEEKRQRLKEEGYF